MAYGKFLLAISATLLFLAAGCSGATPYQPRGLRGGYADRHLRDNLYFVEVHTNASTDYSTAMGYLHRRAKEVCIENGYSDYKFLTLRDVSTQMASASSGYGTTVASSLNQPGFTVTVECTR